MTPEPVFVRPEVAALCVRPVPAAIWDQAAKETGPHFPLARIRVWMSENAGDAFGQKASVYPVGSVVVKEKLARGWIDPTAVGPQAGHAVGAMVKQAPGYDPENGDWMYLWDDGEAPRVSGPLPSCIACHRAAEATDFVFGEWDDDRR